MLLLEKASTITAREGRVANAIRNKRRNQPQPQEESLILDRISIIVLVILCEHWVIVLQFGSHEFVHGDHQARELGEEVYHEGLIRISQQLLHVVW